MAVEVNEFFVFDENGVLALESVALDLELLFLTEERAKVGLQLALLLAQRLDLTHERLALLFAQRRRSRRRWR